MSETRLRESLVERMRLPRPGPLDAAEERQSLVAAASSHSSTSVVSVIGGPRLSAFNSSSPSLDDSMSQPTWATVVY